MKHSGCSCYNFGGRKCNPSVHKSEERENPEYWNQAENLADYRKQKASLHVAHSLKNNWSHQRKNAWEKTCADNSERRNSVLQNFRAVRKDSNKNSGNKFKAQNACKHKNKRNQNGIKNNFPAAVKTFVRIVVAKLRRFQVQEQFRSQKSESGQGRYLLQLLQSGQSSGASCFPVPNESL